MGSEDNLIKTFASCFRLLAKLNAGMQNSFFVNLLAGESDKLLAEYVKFLKIKCTTSQVVHNARLAMSYRNNVAQCQCAIVNQIKTILNLLNILNYLNLIKLVSPLLLERELLKLQLLLLNYNRTEPLSRGIEVSNNSVIKENNYKNKNAKPVKLNVLHKQIAGFIQNKKLVQNIEVFGQFADTTRRTLKRKLSELIKASVIKKQTKGKEVYYFPHQ
ncbi:MAG: hypothetical protein HYX20_03345 [Candidatus Yanofskybacteria bacterium]|nr:hypothetical protein [Candidatus Yanofskybacteria bacterium]